MFHAPTPSRLSCFYRSSCARVGGNSGENMLPVSLNHTDLTISWGRSAKIAYTWSRMIRISTALLVLLSIVATPLAGVAYMTRCELFLMHQHPVCRYKAHENMAPHMHHVNHVQMVNQEREPALASQNEQSKLLVAPVGCPTCTCASMVQAVPSRKTVRSSKLEASSYIPAVAVHGFSLRSSQNSYHSVAASSDSPPCNTSAPLRI